ncbi:MAG: glycosyltransferase family 39 protein [Phycisphaerae bacterium]|nr:glycosyltransferase family 39 protein [Phycisphaerae bacterium]
MEYSRNNGNSARRTKGFIIGGVLLLSAVSALWTLSERPLNNHECFVSITAREMLQSGDWIRPTCNGESRLQKTPLCYWLVAGLAQMTGNVDEFTTRLPSAVFGVLSAIAILYFVSQWLSVRAAAISAGVWGTSIGYVTYTHNARPEMALTFFILLCFLSFYSAITAKDRRKQIWYMLVFWISFALGNLAKGPAPLPLVLIPLFFYVSISRQWKKLFNWTSVIGVIIFLAIVLPWPLAIAHKLNWDLTLWKNEFVDRFLGDYVPGHKPIYYYLLEMFIFIAPWVAFLPMAMAAPFFEVWNKKRSTMQFLWLWFVVDLVFITISGGKRQHYILPLMPAAAILIGILLEDMIFVHKAYTQKYARDILRNHIVALIAAAIAGPIYIAKAYPELLTGAIIIGAVTIAAVAVIALLFARGKPGLACWTTFAGIVVLVMIAYVVFVNPLNYNQPSREFTRIVVEKVSAAERRDLAEGGPASEKLIAYKSASMRFIHYFGKRVPEIATEPETYKLYNEGCWVVAFGKYLDELIEKDKFEIVYIEEQAERHKGNVVYGALLHKSARPAEDNM